jgi:hypothetical protein
VFRRASVLVAAVLLGGCGAICENEISQSIPSRSGAMKAVVFNRACGATVGFNTQVSILPSNTRLPDEGANVLIMDGSVALKIHWNSDTALRISGVTNAPMSKQELSLDGVHIVYAN